MDHLKAEKIMCKALFAILFAHYNQNLCLINTSCEYKSDFYNNKKVYHWLVWEILNKIFLQPQYELYLN